MVEVFYSYTDLTPLLNKAQQNADNLWQKAYSLNVGRIATPKTPKEWYETLPEKADSWSIPAKRKVKNTIKEIESWINAYQELMQQYRDETNRRNAILNRMGQLRWVMRDWYNSDAKNKLAWINMVVDSVKEYSKLKQEANKFLKYIKK